MSALAERKRRQTERDQKMSDREKQDEQLLGWKERERVASERR